MARRPARGINLDFAVNNRQTRQAARAGEQQRRDGAVAMDERFEEAGIADDPDNIRDNLDNDLDWIPAANYDPVMRLTDGADSRTCRMIVPSQNPLLQTVAWTRIGPTAGRADAGTVMGPLAQPPVATITAQAFAGRGQPHNQGTKVQWLEWCHLIADSLGGPTVHTNLVAASYSANTEMNVIEQRIQGRNELEVEVEVHCNRAHVAEIIIYRVRHPLRPNNAFVHYVDAHNAFFNRHDLDNLNNEITAWFRSIGLPARTRPV
jgi:hypothetical protein